MISWIQRTFQQHFRVVFGILLAVTIVSFIATIGAAPGIGNGDRRTTEQDFYGRNLASAAEMNQVIGEASLSLSLQSPQGYDQYDADQTREYALQRVAALHLANEWHLPEVAGDSPEMVNFVKSLPLFTGQNGVFDAERYARIRASLQSGGREGEVERVLADDYRIQRVEALLGGPGYLQPGDVRNDLIEEDTTWTVAMARIDFRAFPAPAAPSPADLAKYFAANRARYTIPAQVSAAYVAFPTDRYLPRVQVTDEEIRAYYQQNSGRFPKKTPPAPAKGVTPPQVKVDPAADFAAVRPEVEAALKRERARTLAMKDASDFSYGLYQNKVTNGPALDAYLASQHVTAKLLPPFSQDAAPAELGGSPDAASAAFQLNDQHFYSEATTTPSGAAVLLWKGNIAPHPSTLAEVEDRVKSDWTAERKRANFEAAVAKLRTDIAARVKSGAPFEKAAVAAAPADGLKLTAKTLPPFKASDRSEAVSPVVMEAVQGLKVGDISSLKLEGDDGYLVYGLAKKLPDVSANSPRFAELRAREGMYFARLTANDCLSEMVRQEMQRTGATAQN